MKICEEKFLNEQNKPIPENNFTERDVRKKAYLQKTSAKTIKTPRRFYPSLRTTPLSGMIREESNK